MLSLLIRKNFESQNATQIKSNNLGLKTNDWMYDQDP
jgi:hypothetical protein